jgi:hypothetical protein
MIRDLDNSLKLLLENSLQKIFQDEVNIAFDPPDANFKPGKNGINLFLYDVRENRDLRTNEWQIDRNGTNSVTKKRPPARVDCSYLITTWQDKDPIGEHYLLGEVMKVLLRHPILPDAILQGELKGQDPSLPVAVLQPGRLQSLGEFWQALGGKPKAALNYTVTIGVEAGEPIEMGPPVTDKRIPSDPTGGTP